MKTAILIIKNLETLEEKVNKRIVRLEQRGYKVTGIRYINGIKSVFGWMHIITILYK